MFQLSSCDVDCTNSCRLISSGVSETFGDAVIRVGAVEAQRSWRIMMRKAAIFMDSEGCCGCANEGSLEA